MQESILELYEPKTSRRTHEVTVSRLEIENYLSHLENKGRVSGTLEWYRRALNKFYSELPEGKHVARDTLKMWQEKLVEEGYAPSTINEFIVVVNGFFEFIGRREFQVSDRLALTDEIQPEMTRAEYLRLLSTAKTLGRERVYLIIKVFANTDMPLQELNKLTVEAARDGRVNVVNKGIRQIIRIPKCIADELLAYAERKGITTGSIFLTREGTPMSRTNVTTGIRQLCVAAQVAEEKGSPRCLRRMYQTTRESIERNIALLVEQAQERLLEEEQLQIGWEDTP